MFLPPLLQEIYNQAQIPEGPPSNLTELRQGWDKDLERLSRRVPGVVIEDRGEIVRLGELSPGCQACKDGAWDCIFITNRCNLACPFCYSPQALPADAAGSAFGDTPGEIAAGYRQTTITGVSFSGGEPFLKPEKLLEWVRQVKFQFPEVYTWVYTNGLAADESTLRDLKDLGVDEIRFNLAATGYDHPLILETLTLAGKLLPFLTVEIPSIPHDREKLLHNLVTWSRLGVRYLNLHELMYEPGTNAASMNGERRGVVIDDGHKTEVDPRSRPLTFEVMEKIKAERIPLAVNDCSLQSKLRQVRGRRKCLAPLTQAPYENLNADGVFETCCAFLESGEVLFFRPAFLEKMVYRYPAHRFARLSRRAPLSIHEPVRWVSFELL